MPRTWCGRDGGVAGRGRGRVGARRLGRGESLASRAPRGVGSVVASARPAVVGVLGRHGCSAGRGGEGGRATAPVGGSRAATARGEKGGSWRLGFYSAGARASGWKR